MIIATVARLWRKLGYGRISSSEQANNTHAAAQQISRLLHAGCQEVFFDIQSGSDDSRPEFEKLMAFVQKSEVDCICITRDDRITRRGITTLQILETFSRCGVQLEILDAGGVSDLANPYEWLQRGQAGLNAEFEIRMLSMRIKRGFEYFREKAKANPKPPYGYIRVYEKYQLDPTINARGQVEAFLKMRTLQGACRLIDEKYGRQWTANGLRRWLINPTLRGHTPYNRTQSGEAWETVIHNTHLDQAVMTEVEYRVICEVFQANKQYWGQNRKSQQYPLGGLMFCDECETKMTVAHGGGERIYVCCRRRKQNIRSQTCSQRRTPRMEIVEDAVISVLVKKAREIVDFGDIPTPTIEPQELQQLRRRLAALSQLGYDPDIEDAKTKLQRRINEFVHSLGQHQQDTDSRIDMLKSFPDPIYWHTLPDDEKRVIFRALIEKVIIKDGAVLEAVMKI
ncbi:MAG: fdxN element excision recombinase XisF [Nostoc sp.]|uniref:fdxN element excision recombinase XisF n=1 Tax=Nostoc sp. TaxID=1180 RepID=UPI002FF0E860